MLDKCKPMTYNKIMDTKQIPQTIVETASYVKAVNAMWDETTQIEFKNYIALNPQQGDIIPGTGGIRKIRWQSSGHGKRGGSRIIYYVYNDKHPIYLLFAYPKNVQANISEKEKKILSDLVSILKSTFKE